MAGGNLTKEQRVFLVKKYFETKSFTEVGRLFTLNPVIIVSLLFDALFLELIVSNWLKLFFTLRFFSFQCFFLEKGFRMTSKLT